MILVEDIIKQLLADASDIEDQTGHITDAKIQFWLKEGMKYMEKASETLQNAVDLYEEDEE